jgi:hypothetical protein
MSLSEYLLAELVRSVERPTLAELRERIARFESPELPPAADVLAEARARR